MNRHDAEGRERKGRPAGGEAPEGARNAWAGSLGRLAREAHLLRTSKVAREAAAKHSTPRLKPRYVNAQSTTGRPLPMAVRALEAALADGSITLDVVRTTCEDPHAEPVARAAAYHVLRRAKA